MVASTPEQVQKVFKLNPKQFLKDYAWYMSLQAEAEEMGLDQKTPYKENLAYQRMVTLVNAILTEKMYDIPVSVEQQKEFYEKHPERFRETKAKLIYIPFVASGGRTEEEAKTLAEQIVGKARTGFAFPALVKQFSEDAMSKSHDGDIGMPVRTTTTQIPANMRTAILKLKAGEISDPVRNANGYYIFKADSVESLPYDKVKDEIFKELKDIGSQQWQKEKRAAASVQFDNEAYFENLGK